MGERSKKNQDLKTNSGEISLLKEIINNNFNPDKKISYKNYTIEKSRRNNVFSVKLFEKKKFIIKIFDIKNNENALINEIAIYLTLKPLNFVLEELRIDRINSKLKNLIPKVLAVPKLIKIGKDFLILDFISGNNLMDLIQKNLLEIEPSDPFWEGLFTGLIIWIIGFNKRFGYYPGDNHIRNFILAEKNLYRVDFEKKIEITEEFDVSYIVFAEVLFSILGSDPGIFDGKCLDYKAQLSITFLKALIHEGTRLNTEILLDNNINHFLSKFLKTLEFEGLMVIQRRKGFNRKGILTNETILNNLKYILKKIIDFYGIKI